MTELNLVANDAAQKRVLEYLQENASETLAEKINKGVHVTIDGKELINVKDLSGFMRFAVDEARKLCEKGATSACVEDDKVFGWAIHYFEEDSIQGKLFTLDGMEYKKERPKTTPKTTITKTTVTAKPEPKDRQISIFDFTDLDTNKQAEEDESEQEDTVTEQIDDVITKQDEDEEQDDVEELETAKEQVQQVADSYSNAKPFYKKYYEIKREFMDSIIFFRLGDFYEIFGDDAITAANILGLTLTTRDVGLPNRVSIAGVPYHALDTYVKKLSERHNVLVYDNDDEKYLVMNGRKIDLVTGEVITLNKETNTKPMEETNPHIRYLQTLIDDLKVDL